jgi:Iron-sulfur cluster-binding domain/Radical SAM superfamily
VLPQFIEVEVGTYCNRRCAWCPNGWHDRGLQRDVMNPALFSSLLADLGKHGFKGWFAFHNYNEPLADPAILDRIGESRAALPGAKLDIHTNGDFLDAELLEKLRAAGLDGLQVTLYPQDDAAFDAPDPKRIDTFLTKLGITRRGRLEDRPSKIERTVRVGRLALSVRLPRVERYNDRAGSVGLVALKVPTPRSVPCTLPTRSAAIDVHGNLKVCCHIYDAKQPEMAPYLMGNLRDASFSELWSGPRMAKVRAQLGRADFEGLSVCAACSHRPPEWMERAREPCE